MEEKQQLDYGKLGLKVGLEIHQQLDTHKLFCHCPSSLRDDAPHFVKKRFLRASAGETGEIDAAAQHEVLKRIHYEYEGYHDTTCLIELDEEPPMPLNNEALNICLQFCKMIDARVVDVIQFMRKTVIDGSNTSGFQRTGLVAKEGMLPDDIRIETVCLEEDACKIVARKHDRVIYNLSRLGIPLIEIATYPDIRSPQQAYDVAKYIGMLLRSTGKVKRGLGTIRQDINVSIADGQRVEIKGAQELRLIPEYVTNEAQRQVNLLVLKNELKNRCRAADIVNNTVDVTSIFSGTSCSWIKKSLDDGAQMIALRLPGFAGLLGMELMPNFRVGTELAGYAKKRGFGGVIHSDENIEKYQFSLNEIQSLEKSLALESSDGWLMFVGNKKKIIAMLDELLIPRIRQFFEGVVKEVREAQPDGTTLYSRPMPGAARMYPETDIPLVYPHIEDIILPELIVDKIQRYVSDYRLPEDIATKLGSVGYAFDNYVNNFPSLKPAFLADLLLSLSKDVKTKANIDYSFSDEQIMPVLKKLHEGNITKDVLLDIFVDIARGKEIDFDAYKSLDTDEIRSIIKKVIAENSGAPIGAIMGKAMAALRGKADGKIVSQIVKEELS